MKSASTLLGMERIPSTSINEYPNDTISYIFAPLSDGWLKGQIGVHSDRSLGELFNPPFLSDEGIEQVKNRARQYSYHGFYMYDQGGKTAAIFFVRENMKSASTLLGMERIPSTSINNIQTIQYPIYLHRCRTCLALNNNSLTGPISTEIDQWTYL